MTIWNGITEQGAVVPIQVDAQGRVVVSGGGGAPAEVFGTAKAWGRVSSTGSFLFGSGATSSQVITGIYEITFTPALSNASYVAFAQPSDGQHVVCYTHTHTASSFRVEIATPAGTRNDTVFDFVVFNGDPSQVTPLILPTSTVEEVKALRSEVEKLKKANKP